MGEPGTGGEGLGVDDDRGEPVPCFPALPFEDDDELDDELIIPASLEVGGE